MKVVSKIISTQYSVDAEDPSSTISTYWNDLSQRNDTCGPKADISLNRIIIDSTRHQHQHDQLASRHTPPMATLALLCVFAVLSFTAFTYGLPAARVSATSGGQRCTGSEKYVSSSKLKSLHRITKLLLGRSASSTDLKIWLSFRNRFKRPLRTIQCLRTSIRFCCKM